MKSQSKNRYGKKSEFNLASISANEWIDMLTDAVERVVESNRIRQDVPEFFAHCRLRAANYPDETGVCAYGGAYHLACALMACCCTAKQVVETEYLLDEHCPPMSPRLQRDLWMCRFAMRFRAGISFDPLCDRLDRLIKSGVVQGIKPGGYGDWIISDGGGR